MTDPIHRYRFASDADAQSALDAITARFATVRERSSTDGLTFYETFDWRLHKAGGTLVETTSGGGTRLLAWLGRDGRDRLRGPAEASPGFADSLPEGPLRETLAPLIEMRRLLPVVRVSRRIEPLSVLDALGQSAVLVEIERATAAPPDGSAADQALPVTLTLQPAKGGRPLAEALIELLGTEHGLAPDPQGLLDHALAAIGRRPGDYSSKLRLELVPGSRADEALRTILSALLSAMEANLAGVRQKIDSEFLHDFRVAVRRSRSALGQIQGVFPAERVQHFRTELAWLGEISTPLRDLDVYLLMMPDFRAELPASAGADLDPLQAFLEHEQDVEQSRLVAGLDSERFAAFVAELRCFLDAAPADAAEPTESQDHAGFQDHADAPVPMDGPELTHAPIPTDTLDASDAPDASLPVEQVADERIWRAYRRVSKQGRAIQDDSPPEALHELRIACKKLRYLIEFFQSLYPRSESQAVVSELKRLQDNLGAINDTEVQHAALAQYADRMFETRVGSAATYMALGRLVEHLERSRVHQRERFDARWERFADVENRARFKLLFKPKVEEVRGDGGEEGSSGERTDYADAPP